MTNLKTTKRALISSVVALLVCFAMLLGTTFAWFTDEATSSGNIIQSGKLDVNMYWAEGNLDPEAAETQWTEAKSGPIFNNDKWEPGYVEAKHIKIANEGTLALKYQMRILANGIVSELADVIDVYYFYEIEEGNEEDLTGAVQLNRASFTEANRLGTLSEVLNVTYDKNIANTISGTLEKETYKTLTLAFKMQESAGNEYQDLSLGADFSIQIIATQYTFEKDSFDTNYDAGADFAPQTTPTATVYQLSKSKLEGITIGGFDGAILDTGYSFQPTETAEQGIASEAANWHADFFVYADADVPANSMALAGYYKAFEGFSFGGTTLSATNWIGLTAPTDIKAGEGLRLIADGMNEGNTLSGITVPYWAICDLGNDGVGFLCGAADLTGANEGTTLTVELRLYKTLSEEECLEQNGFKSENYETGEYITIGTFTYTFGGQYTTLDDGSEVFMGHDGDVTLVSVENVTATEYYVPDGVTKVDTSFGSNLAITKVVFPETVRELGYNNFKDSAVETVELNEGLTEIADFAFSGAKNLANFNIPSTVKVISGRAFRSTAATEITIPAGVEKIEEAFRDMANLTKVTFEGNTQISPYSFRGCANLTEVVLLGDDVTFSAKSEVYVDGVLQTPNSGMVFTNTTGGDASKITIKVQNATVAARVVAANTSALGYKIELNEKIYTPKLVEADKLSNELTATKFASLEGGTNMMYVLKEGTYTGTNEITVDNLGAARGDLYFIGADGANVVLSGTTTLGYHQHTVGAATYVSNVTFENITFDHAGVGDHSDDVVHHSLDIQDINSINLINCTIIGDGECGIYSPSQNTCGPSKIIGCTFENAAMQVYGNFGTGLVIDDCTFNNSRVNVQGGKSVTIQNCVFNNTLTAANVDDSFYAIRSNSTPITVKKCELNIDSELTEVATSQAKWYLLANRGTTDWTVENVSVTLTDSALKQTELKVTACTSTGAINATNLTVNGVAQ